MRQSQRADDDEDFSVVDQIARRIAEVVHGSPGPAAFYVEAAREALRLAEPDTDKRLTLAAETLRHARQYIVTRAMRGRGPAIVSMINSALGEMGRPL